MNKKGVRSVQLARPERASKTKERSGISATYPAASLFMTAGEIVCPARIGSEVGEERGVPRCVVSQDLDDVWVFASVV